MRKILAYMFPHYFSRTETWDELIIRWADTIVLKSDYTGKLDKRSFKLDWVFEPDPKNQQEVDEWMNSPDRAIRESIRTTLEQTRPMDIQAVFIPHLEAVKLHLLSNGYISTIEVVKQEWVLNGRGRLMKEIGGHKKYLKYRKRQINILQNQSKVNIWLIAGTCAAAVLPFIIALISTTPKQPLPVQSPKIEVRIDSSLLRSIVEDILKNRDSTKE